jgi:hypothetical protein
VELTLKDPLDSPNLLIGSKKFFCSEADVQKCRITFYHTEKPEEHFQIIMFYDRNTHGTPKCPYLAYKLENGNKLIDLDRDDYVTVIKAVDW